jgi:TonB-linked SusC/RagA family outer membrane protein
LSDHAIRQRFFITILSSARLILIQQLMKIKKYTLSVAKNLLERLVFFMPIMLMAAFSLLIIPHASAQTSYNHTVRGHVADEQNDPVPGVNVILKGTTNGTITDVDGNYTINVNSNSTLQYRFIGYELQEIDVEGRSTINVTLEADVTDLEEVVVVGYGEVTRANVLGSVSSMSSREIEDIPVTNLTELLEGRMAGVNVSPAQPTGNPGASTRVTIRTETTFGNSGDGIKDPTPLYIVDGFEVTQDEFNIMDPSEFESISVLKDASAAVYGSKGANGVILVKTKRGREGKLRVSYSGSVGISDATNQTEMLSAYDHARMLNAKNVNNPDWQMISDQELDELKGVNYDWLDMAWQKSMVTRHTINVSGGSDRVKYFAGGAYNYTGGNFEDMGVGKQSYRIGLDAKIIDGLTASITLAYDSKDFTRPYAGATGTNTMQNIFEELLQAPKWMPSYIDGLPVDVSGNNILAMFETDSYKKNVSKGNTLNVKLTYDFPKIDGLSTSFSYSRRENNSYSKEYRIPFDLYRFSTKTDYRLILSEELYTEGDGPLNTVNNGNRINESYSFGQRYQLNASVNYTRKFGEHNVSGLLVYEQAESTGYSFGATAEQIQILGIETQNAFNRTAAVSEGSMSEGGDLGAVARLNYAYGGKYHFESTLRFENSSNFAPGYRSGLFPSASVGWVPSEEDFWKENIFFINYMKTRFSMGLTGYNSVGAYEYLVQFKPTTSAYLFGGSPLGGINISGKTGDVFSTGVTWEKSLMHNMGIDMKLFDSKLSLAVDAYYTYQYDILDKRTVEFPITAGIEQMPGENVGRLEAWGYDMELGYHGQVGYDFKWNVKGMFAFGTNRILERPTQYLPSDFRYPIGKSTSAEGREQGYISNGIIRSQEQLDAINAEWNEKWGHDYNIGGRTDLVGSLFLQDLGRPGVFSEGEPSVVYEPDGKIDVENNDSPDKTYLERANDQLVWKNMLPTSVSLGATWKSFQMSMLWTMSYGITNKVVDKLARTVPDSDKNAPAFWSDFWTEDNPNAKYPNPQFEEVNKFVTTFWMKDVYQLRLRNLNISYNLPSDLSQKWNIPGLRVYFTGANLWTPISTFDYKEDAISRFNTYPLMRTFSFGVNLKF